MPVFGATDTSSMESSSTLHWVVNRVNQTHISVKYQVWYRYHIRTIFYFFALARTHYAHFKEFTQTHGLNYAGKNTIRPIALRSLHCKKWSTI